MDAERPRGIVGMMLTSKDLDTFFSICHPHDVMFFELAVDMSQSPVIFV